MELTGSVADQKTGKPLPNVTIWEIPADGQSAQVIGYTDYAGRYDVNTAVSDSTVNFAQDGYTSTAIPVLQASNSDQILLPPDGSIVATLKLSGVPSWLWLFVGGLVVLFIGDSKKRK